MKKIIALSLSCLFFNIAFVEAVEPEIDFLTEEEALWFFNGAHSKDKDDEGLAEFAKLFEIDLSSGTCILF